MQNVAGDTRNAKIPNEIGIGTVISLRISHAEVATCFTLWLSPFRRWAELDLLTVSHIITEMAYTMGYAVSFLIQNFNRKIMLVKPHYAK